MRHQHNSFVPTGVVDEQVVRKHAEQRFREDHETTWVHKHRYRERCDHHCYEWPKVEVVL